MLSLVALFTGLVAHFFFYFYFLLIFNFFILIIFLIYFILFYFVLFFIYCFLPFLLNHVADRVLVLQPGVRPEPLRWERRVQDIGPQETSQYHIISIGESSPRDLCLIAKTQLHSTASKQQC